MEREVELAVITGIIFLIAGVIIIYEVGQFSIDLILTYLGFGLIVAGIIEMARMFIKNGHGRRGR